MEKKINPPSVGAGIIRKTWLNEACRQVDIAGATHLVLCYVVKFCYLKIGHQDNSPSNGHQGDMPYTMLANVTVLVPSAATVSTVKD